MGFWHQRSGLGKRAAEFALIHSFKLIAFSLHAAKVASAEVTQKACNWPADSALLSRSACNPMLKPEPWTVQKPRGRCYSRADLCKRAYSKSYWAIPVITHARLLLLRRNSALGTHAGISG